MTGHRHSNDTDIIIIGAGIIGLSLACEIAVRDPDRSITVLERGEPGREASWAAAGMISPDDSDGHEQTPTQFRELARYSAELYPGFIRQVEEFSGQSTGFSQSGALYVSAHPVPGAHELTSSELVRLEPALAADAGSIYYLAEASVDPRALVSALLAACRKQSVEVHHEHEVFQILTLNGTITGARTRAGEFRAPIVVNCAGAWANLLPLDGQPIPVAPVKGQMLAVLPAEKPLITHTIRSKDIYFLPRPDGHIVIGSTVEHAGYDKRVEPEVIQRLLQLAANLVPALGQARIADTWAGLRPGSPDHLPLLGRTGVAGYFLSTGHYRNGILLAPASARLMAQQILGRETDLDLSRFSPGRFAL